MRAHRKKEEEDQKGFDALEASFLEKGLVAAGSSRSMYSKAVGETHSHQERHHAEREKTHRAEFVSRERGSAPKTRAEFLITLSRKAKPKRALAPPQMKRKDEDERKK